jgi:hypothetical protein
MAKTSIEKQAEKNAQAILKEARTKQSIKEHNIRAALKNEKKNKPDKSLFGIDYKGSTEKSDSLNKELRKTRKSKKFIDKTQDILDERGVTGVKTPWYKPDKAPSTVAKVQKIKLEKKLPSTEGSFKGGGIALRGLGRAFLKGGKV